VFQNLERVEEELQSSGATAPAVPMRLCPVNAAAAAAITAAAAAAAGDDGDDDERDYLELHEDELLYESTDVLQPITRQLRMLPDQVSMPESALPPSFKPRKQSCPETAVSGHRAPKLLPQTSADAGTGRPADSGRPPKPAEKPPVASRKKEPYR